MADDTLKQTYIGKLTMNNNLVYNYSTVDEFEINEFKTINDKLYGSVYFNDIKNNITKKAWVLVANINNTRIPMSEGIFYQFYQDETASKKVSINDIFTNSRNDGYLEVVSPPL